LVGAGRMSKEFKLAEMDDIEYGISRFDMVLEC
jgi:hypothetical protein